ncbi:hypothetical protein ACFRAE_06380 [Sphingobacterium sp. HJSM2_6]|uniref:hypothetical protein n=1 Tax=Sphingobacterium sp. HJSM2_6 TaxID=3366264 RepID=UPI003BE92609
MRLKIQLLAFILLPFVFGTAAYAQSKNKMIHVEAYGIIPNSKVNVQPIIEKICDEHPEGNFTLLFPKGRFDFYPDEAHVKDFKAQIAFDLTGLKNIQILADQSEFVFHGRMMPFRIDKAKNIQLKGFSLDWDRPMISQAQIVGVSDNYVDLAIDSLAYPYEIVRDSIYFLGEGWRSKITKNYNNLYDKVHKEIVYQTRDNPLGELYNAKVSALKNNQVRFHMKPLMKPELGTYIALYHGAYITDGILLINSEQVQIEDVVIYHTLSCGVSGYRTKDILLKNVKIIANDKKGRVFSTVADATHFNGCEGKIVLDGVEMTGAGDDFTNIHGMYAEVTQVLDDQTFLVKPNGRYIGFNLGEKAWIVDTLSMQRKDSLAVIYQETLWKDGLITGYKLKFDGKPKQALKPGDLLENINRNPEVEIRNCKILKRHRARGILVTTASKAVIENNYFRTAGAAILIEGDIELWYESGANRNLLIQHNVFEDCYSSGNNILDKPWGWGEAVISITPSVKPENVDFPTYHQKIHIVNNTFKHYDHAILYARSVNDLVFSNNKLIRTKTYKPFYREVGLYLDGCRHVTIASNKMAKNFLGKTIQIQHMRKTDVQLIGEKHFQILD